MDRLHLINFQFGPNSSFDPQIQNLEFYVGLGVRHKISLCSVKSFLYTVDQKKICSYQNKKNELHKIRIYLRGVLGERQA